MIKYVRFFCFLLLSIAVSVSVKSQVTESLRVTFDESQNDESNKIATDNQGNIIICGTFTENGAIRIETIKYSPSGNILWNKKYKGPAFEDRVAGISVDNQNNIYIGGYSEGQDGVFHFLLIKYSGSTGDSILLNAECSKIRHMILR